MNFSDAPKVQIEAATGVLEDPAVSYSPGGRGWKLLAPGPASQSPARAPALQWQGAPLGLCVFLGSQVGCLSHVPDLGLGYTTSHPRVHHLGCGDPSTSPVQLPIEFPKLTPHPRPCSPALLWWEKAHLPPAERRPQLPRPELAPTPHPGRPQPLDSAVPHTLPTASPASHSQAAAACCPRPSGKAGVGPAPSPPALPPGSAVLSSVQEPQLPRTIQKALGVKTASPVTPKRCPFHSCSACTAERPMT